MNKADLRRLLEVARSRGWRVERTGSGHWRLRHPNGATVMAASTPRNPSALRNLRADLKRAEREEGRP